MTNEMLTTLLEEAADRRQVGPAPVVDMLARVHRMRQRRTILVATSTSAAVLALIIGTVTLLSSGPDQRPQPAPQLSMSPSDTPSDSQILQLDGSWVVTALVDRTGGQPLIPDSYAGRVLMTFHDGELTGTTGCNDIFGAYQQSGGRDLVFPREQLGSTLVGCSDEPPLVGRLLDVRHVSASGGAVYLHADNWMIIAELRRSDVDIDGEWSLQSAEMGGDSFTPTTRSHLTLVISAAGNQAQASCTVVSLEPQVHGASVKLREIDRGSMLSCPPNYRPTEFDEPYLQAIGAVDHATRSDDVLTMTGPEVTLTFVKTQ